jgi:thermolabile hemolysin
MRWTCYLALVLGLTGGTPKALSYDALYAFGDSLTDTGREPAEPYFHYDGRWSNGPLWVEYLSVLLGFSYNPDNNLAHSGAQTDDTLGQVIAFVPASDAGHSLFVVWAGGNDFLQEYDKHWFDDGSWDRQIAYSVGNLSNAVVNLYSKGARFILVPNTVDVSEIPLLNFLPGFVSDYLRGKVEQFNGQLAATLNQIQSAYPALKLFQFDFYSQVNLLLDRAGDYGFTKTDIDALSDVTLLDKRFDGPGANYVFWDPIHPTTKSHGMIAGWFQAAVAAASPQIAIATDGAVLNLTVGNPNAGQTYVLQRSSDLVGWSDVEQFSGGAAPLSMNAADGSPRTFFRLKLQQR